MFIVSMSPIGSTLASTWITSSSWKARTTWQMASVSRIEAKNLLPNPSPCDAPRTRPAMSTNVTVAGTIGRAVVDGRECLEPRVGHGDHADVGIDGGEGIVGSQDLVAA